jgi:hypothetical protein
MEILKDEEVVDLLSTVHKSLLPFYSFYANNKGFMNFEGFTKFCHDFNLFPDVLTKAKMMKFFVTLSNFFISTNNDNEIESRIESKFNSEQVIDEHLFIEALALTALEVSYN